MPIINNALSVTAENLICKHETTKYPHNVQARDLHLEYGLQPFENEAFGMTATLAIRHQVFPILLWHQDHHHLAINPSLPVHIHMIHIFLYGHLRVCV